MSAAPVVARRTARALEDAEAQVRAAVAPVLEDAEDELRAAGLPDVALELVAAAAAAAVRGERYSVDAAARARCVSRRQLSRQLQEAGAPAPRYLVQLGRALPAAALLELGATGELAAQLTSWPDPYCLSAALHRASGLRFRTVRRAGVRVLVSRWTLRGAGVRGGR